MGDTTKEFTVKWSTQFKKDYKKAIKRKLNIDLLDNVIRKLGAGETLPPEFKDHELVGNWKNHRECHIQNDWLLIYQISENILVLELTRTGSHSELFRK